MTGHPGQQRFADIERSVLADTLHQLGPGAPTLCEGWESQHLAAHLVVRERRPVAALGNVISPLAKYTERVQRDLAERDGGSDSYARLVEMVRAGPHWGVLRLARVDEALNLVEFFVHHEDLLRAQPGWQARELAPGYEQALWRRVTMIGRFRPPFPERTTRLVAPGYPEVPVGRGAASCTLSGTPQELLLWLLGRRSVAAVALVES